MGKERFIIINAGPCAWGKCIFCSFSKRPRRKPTLQEMIDEFERKTKGEFDTLKLFNSGSFFDENQIPAEFRRYVFRRCREKGIKHLIVESRPEFISDEMLRKVKEEAVGLKITVAIGLEAADDKLLAKIMKGFTLADYERAVALLRKYGFGVRTYLMANLPFDPNPKETIRKSIEYALRFSDSIAVMNTFALAYAPLFELWIRGEWHPIDYETFMDWMNEYAKNPKVEIYFWDFVKPPIFPPHMRKPLVGVGTEYIKHPYFEIWFEYIIKFWKPPAGKEIALFLPCAARKPYSKSRTHRAIESALRKLKFRNRIHKIVISNAGIIPWEFQNYYPFNAYDWDERKETPEIQKAYYEITKERLKEFLKKKAEYYKHICCYLKPDSLTYAAFKDACNELGIEFIDLVDHELYGKIEEKPKLANKELLKRMVMNFSALA